MQLETTISLFTALVLLTTVLVNFRNLQINRKGQREQNFYSASKLIMDYWEEIQAIHKLHEKKTSFEMWESTDKDNASKVCLCFHQIGGLLKSGAVPETVCELFYFSIPRTREILNEYLNSVRDRNNSEYRHESYWSEFDYLVERTKALNFKKDRRIDPISAKNARDGKEQ